MAAEFLPEINSGGALLKDFVGLGAELVDEILHLPAVLTPAGGIDQLVYAIEKRPVAPVRRSVAGSKTAFPAQ